MCKGRIFNLHPSLLPKYRGCSSLTWAIINDENECGYTYHLVDDGIDTGNVLMQEKIPIMPFDTQQTLYNRVMIESMEKFNIVLNMVAEDQKGVPQKGLSSMYPRGCPYDGEINPMWDDGKIERFIRAMNYPPMRAAKYKGIEIKSMTDYKKVRSDEK